MGQNRYVMSETVTNISNVDILCVQSSHFCGWVLFACQFGLLVVKTGS